MRVVCSELAEYYEENPARLKWQSSIDYYGRNISKQFINNYTKACLEHYEDPLCNPDTLDEKPLYDIVFDTIHSISQSAAGMEYNEQDALSKRITTLLQQEAKYDMLRSRGIDDDLHSITDI